MKEWLHLVTQRMLTVFLRSNLYNALPLLYGDMGLFASAAMGTLDDDDDIIRAYSYPVGSLRGRPGQARQRDGVLVANTR